LGGGGEDVEDSSNTAIFRIQKRVTCTTVGVNSRIPCKQLFKEIKILTLASLCILEVTYFIKNYCQSLELNSKVYTYNTWRKMDIHVQSYKTDICKKTVINIGTKLYYKMPGYLKEMDNYEAFKTELKPFILFHAFFHSVEEFVSL
jgi:hypothetical protein